MKDRSVRRWSAFHRNLFRLTNGRVGKRLVDNDMLLLSTTGRRTGAEHVVPLLYLQDGDRLVVVASYGGRPHHPEWYLNLEAHPSVEVQLRGRVLPMRARTMSDEERAAWWPRVTDAYSGYIDYQGKTDRQIPLVELSPVS